MRVTVDILDLGRVTIDPMQSTERALVLSTWMRSSHWHRKDIVRVVDGGEVLVASSDGVALAWLAMDGGGVAHAYTKQGFRGLGLQRELWGAAGMPTEHVEDATRRTKRVLAHLRGAK